MRELGDVVVVAPDKPQSGMGHAITVHTPLRVRLLKEEEGYQEYSCNGTPVDCVKLGEQEYCVFRNHGSCYRRLYRWHFFHWFFNERF